MDPIPDTVVPINPGFRAELAISGEVLVHTARSCFLIYSATTRSADGTWSRAGFALVEFPGCQQTRFGHVRDELPNHPLSAATEAQGEQWTGVHEVVHSSWMADVHRAYGPPAAGRRFRHFLFQFHDTVFECIAEGMHAELHTEPFTAVLQRVTTRVRAE